MLIRTFAMAFVTLAALAGPTLAASGIGCHLGAHAQSTNAETEKDQAALAEREDAARG
ncbi:MAG: hypothetical protein AAGE61_01830 [Pseudomonadota bacterium]